jgi:phosphate-selective porin OprO and OprP
MKQNKLTKRLQNNIPIPRGAAFALVGLASVCAVKGADAPVEGKPTSPATPAAKQPSAYDQIWKSAQLYKDESNPVIQSFAFTGRFQLDYVRIESNRADHDEWNIRRFRVGGKAKLFKDFTLHGEVDIDPQETVVYQRVTDLHISWSRKPELKLTIGKHSAPFTMDGWTSSKELIAIDRSNLSNNLWHLEEYIPGVSADGQIDQWMYHVGVYSSGARDKEVGNFSGGYFGLGSIGYDFANQLEVKQALLRGDYVYNEPDKDNTFTRSLQHVASINFSLDTGKWGLRTDIAGGLGYGTQSDLWGAMLMPFYNITAKFQAVARYTFLQSHDPSGVRFNRYENVPQVMGGKRGDEYHEFYMGLNYYLYGHKLKLQTGLQFADMRDSANKGADYSGWGWTTGLRIAW